MQVPDYTFRPLAPGESVRENEVEVTAEQKRRIEMLQDESRIQRERMLSERKGYSKGSRKRRGW